MTQPPPPGSQPWLPPQPVSKPEHSEPWQSVPPTGPPDPPLPPVPPAPPVVEEDGAVDDAGLAGTEISVDGESPTVTMMPGDLECDQLDGVHEAEDNEDFERTAENVLTSTAELPEHTAPVPSFAPPVQITPPDTGNLSGLSVPGPQGESVSVSPAAPGFAPPTSAPVSPAFAPVPPVPPAPPAQSTGGQAWPAPPAPPAPSAFPAAGAASLPAAETVPEQRPPREPRSRRKLFVWLGIAAAVVVVVGGLAIAVNQINASRDPAAQVEEYLDLLASGKAAAASKLVDPRVGDASLLTDEVLANAEEQISVTSVETLERTGEGARVLATMSLAGEQFKHEFAVDHGENELLVLDTWNLAEPLLVEATVSLRAPMSGGDIPATANISGTELVLSETMTGDDWTTVYLYPAVYEVAPMDMGVYLDGSVETLVASPSGAMATVDLATELNDEFEAEILSQAKAYADGCVSINGSAVVKSNMDSACPAITKNTRLSELRVLQYAKGLSDVSAKRFTTDQYEFEVRSSTASARLDRSLADLEGEISWKDGKPTIVDARFDLW